MQCINKIFIFSLLLLFASCARTVTTSPTCVVEYKTPPIAKKTETIIIDAGHGGKDSGAISKRFHYEEKGLTLSTAQMVSRNLEQIGYKTVLTRHGDTFISLSRRAEIANAQKAQLFVSIHYNYSPNEEAKGVEVYYFKESQTPSSPRIAASKQLGQEILKGVVQHTGAISRGLKQANFAVIRETEMPAILIEAGFLSNPTEREKVKNLEYQKTLARGIAKGIDQYLEMQKRR